MKRFRLGAGRGICWVLVVLLVFCSIPAQAAKSPYIGVIHIEGTIEDSTSNYEYDHSGTLEAIEKLVDDEDNKALLLYLNSPGGAIYESDELYNAVLSYKQRTDRPVVAYLAQTATSGAYYVACAADQIYAHRMSITGSIGIIMEIEDYSELMGKLGIKSHLVVSGPNKAVGGTQPVTDEQLALYQQIADESYEIFLDVVSQGRNKPVEEIRLLADGRILSAKQALNAGLIDKIADYQATQDAMLAMDGLYMCEFTDCTPGSDSYYGGGLLDQLKWLLGVCSEAVEAGASGHNVRIAFE